MKVACAVIASYLIHQEFYIRHASLLSIHPHYLVAADVLITPFVLCCDQLSVLGI